jgi:hypothetical protein
LLEARVHVGARVPVERDGCSQVEATRVNEWIRNWGSTLAERERPYPCDELAGSHQALFRAVTVQAPRHWVFRWLCQLRLAPYSYDWIDNLGRQSPRQLVDGCDQLANGQKVMLIFRLVDFEPGVQITLKTSGPLAVTYALTDIDGGSCRLVAKLVVHYPAGPIGWAMRLLLPLGDLLMMRRQLLNLKALAESTCPRR